MLLEAREISSHKGLLYKIEWLGDTTVFVSVCGLQQAPPSPERITISNKDSEEVIPEQTYQLTGHIQYQDGVNYTGEVSLVDGFTVIPIQVEDGKFI